MRQALQSMPDFKYEKTKVWILLRECGPKVRSILERTAIIHLKVGRDCRASIREHEFGKMS